MMKNHSNNPVSRSPMAAPTNYEAIQAAVAVIEGFMVPGQEEYLFNKVRSLPENAVIVEIGSFKGRSTVAMGYACVGTQRRIYCIDTWDGNDADFPDRNFFDIWQHNLQANHLLEYVTPLQGYSQNILTDWEKLTDGASIDFIFIDGSHQYLDVLSDFKLSFPLVKDNGWIAFHDVIHTWPGSESVWHHIAKPCLANHEYSTTLACGQKRAMLPLTLPPDLPIHFFTIVLNGEPFIRYHLDIFKQLPCQWHWHIVEGVADLRHDTAWSLQHGGQITADLHRNGLSKDGTSEYLDEIARLNPDQITLYRQPEGTLWDGKLAMVNAPLANLQTECLLWQIDVDELWTLAQLERMRILFMQHPEKTAAFFRCWYFVGENLVISSRHCFTQHPNEWLRAWRFKPGAVWAAHEPPLLVEPADTPGEWQPVAQINPFLEAETEQCGLVFQHFSYVTSEQLEFKERYYGYTNIVEQWQTLQAQTRFPVLLRQYFQWLGDTTLVDTTSVCGVTPIAQRQTETGQWQFVSPLLAPTLPVVTPKTPLIVIDGVAFQAGKTGLTKLWRALLQVWADQAFGSHLLVLDRSGTAPAVPGIRYHPFPPYSDANQLDDQKLVQRLCDEVGADLFISTHHTTPLTTPSVFLAHDLFLEAVGAAHSLPEWRAKHHCIDYATAFVAVSESTAQDLVKFFPGTTAKPLTTVLCGIAHDFEPASPEEVLSFKTKYGIGKPYFLLTSLDDCLRGDRSFFQAFSQLCSRQGFELLWATDAPTFDPALRTYTAGSTVHHLALGDQELRLAYAGAVALVHAAKYDSLGLTVLEAMACGCPVITTPTALMQELAGDAVLYVNEGSVEAMVEALCDIQKPSLRQQLIHAGRARSPQFSWVRMAAQVRVALLEATLLPFNLRLTNFIAFPDWEQSEALLLDHLATAVKTVLMHPDSQHSTLLIYVGNSDIEAANFALSDVTMSILMSGDLDLDEEALPEITLLPILGQMQWEVLLPSIQTRIELAQEDQLAIAQTGAAPLAILKP